MSLKLMNSSLVVSTAAGLLALITASANAQSTVQIGGLLDLSAGRFQAAGTSELKAVQSGQMTTSYLGFNGRENLGGGLSALFSLG